MILEYTDVAKSRIKKACAKNPEVDKALSRKIASILRDPEHFKPLRHSHKGKRRVHILNSFVLTYTVRDGIVYILDFDHHDRIYDR